jgi:glutamate racemase
MRIGVFDSGIGGLSVANAIKKRLPDAEVIFVNDSKNVPYGTKTPEVLIELVTPILMGLVEKGCEVIVIACNTVTTTIINTLRKTIFVPLIGMEPMIKPAAELTKTGVITVCATPTTLRSDRYHELKQNFAKGVTVNEPDCSHWAQMIETNTLDTSEVQNIVSEAIAKNSDVIVLGCTHYHWIEQMISTYAKGKAIVLQPEKPVIEELMRVLERQP